MRRDDIKLYDILTAASRNAIWSTPGQNTVSTNMHIGTTLHLIETALSLSCEKAAAKPSKYLPPQACLAAASSSVRLDYP